MIGLILWREPDKRKKSVTTEVCTVLHMRFLKVEIAREPRTPEVLIRRRIRAALRQLRREGVTRVVLPKEFYWPELLEKQGVRPVSALSLRRCLAAEWAGVTLLEKGISGSTARVAVSADRLTGEIVRTVTELVLRHRYVLLDLPGGGEELCRQLRREYGVTLLLAPSVEQVRDAEIRVAFDRREWDRDLLCLRLYDESQPLPQLLLPPALEQQLPEGANRVQLLAALQEGGVLRSGKISLETPQFGTERKAK